MLDYETLRVIWWLILGVILIGFAITDGFDLGVGAIFRFIGRTDEERRALLESVEPVWEGNQVWFILGGGAAFAAWPLLYAASFSGLYLAMFLVLVALILRPVGFSSRNKLDDTRWRNAWDWVLFVGGVVPALLFGVAFGNLFLGVPFHFDELQRPVHTAGFFNLLHPFALLAGLVSLSMLVMHGASYASMKVEDPISWRAAGVGRLAAAVFVVAFVLAGLWVALGLDGHRIVSGLDPDRSVQSGRQGRGSRSRGLARKLPRARRAVARAGWRGARCRAHLGTPRRAAPRRRVHRELLRAGGNDPDRGDRALPVPYALIHSSEPRADGLGCFEQCENASDHADRRARVPADRPGLHGLGVQGAPRQDHARGNPSSQRAVLKVD